VLTIFEAGPFAGLWTLILMLLGLPVYAILLKKDLATQEGK
jgi:hypothetical protein